MKRKIILTVIATMMITMAGCGKKPSDSQAEPTTKSTQETDVTEEKESSDVTEQKAQTDAASGDTTGVYPDATGITEIAMGVTEDICTFKVPLNYGLAGSYYDENNEGHTIKGLDSATTTIEEAIAEGAFSTGNHLASFTMSPREMAYPRITVNMYVSDMMTWDELKAYYSEAKTIGNENMPALLYQVEALEGQAVAVALKLSDDITMQIVYEDTSSLESEIGEDELGQRLYNLVTVK